MLGAKETAGQVDVQHPLPVLKRFPDIQVVEEPKRIYSTFVKGYAQMKVVIPTRY